MHSDKEPKRSSTNIFLKVLTKKKICREITFQVTAPASRLWNALSEDTRICETTERFKTNTKIMLFSTAFYSIYYFIEII